MNKAKEIETPKGILLLIDTADNIKEMYKYDDGICIFGDATTHRIFGKWKELGFLSNITERQAKKIVDKLPKHIFLQGDFYENYMDDESMFQYATDSLISLIESKVPLKNYLLFWEKK